MQLEVCIDSLAAAAAAVQGGCWRLEVCGPLIAGGTTPSVGLVKAVDNLVRSSECKYRVMLRSRAGDFCYNDLEKSVMLEDANSILALDLSSIHFEGFVVGALTPSLDIDFTFLRDLPLLEVSGNTFHRACDVSRQRVTEATVLQQFQDLRIDTILSSGRAPNCAAGVQELSQMCKAAQEFGICVVPAGGLNSATLGLFLQRIRAAQAQINWVHSSASVLVKSRTPAALFTEWRTVSIDEVEALVKELRNG
eukprot:Gregarina_sp_Poly_1__9920@NODE_650_length_6954_cov_20_000436_g494_i0_p4_GENE_NODE_650_length_6954_cov_20_000436_g494_i0NODE_650_length_6954_cov_20_000436_g494_i0_p4_ORF_typecomplete_len251_score41_15CutC/PF03932_14/5_7e46_NODE_650_length_6954_cov_20_000436_g494_i061826934